MKWYKNINWIDWLDKQNITIDNSKLMVVISEGVDCAGKSTINELLQEIIRHTFLIHTSAPPKGSPPEYYKNLLLNSIPFIKSLRQPVIIDRFHVGESVYGKVFRGYELNTREIEPLLRDLNAKQVYVTAATEVIVKRLKERGDWYVEEEDIQPILDGYEAELKNSNLPTFTLDTSNDISERDMVLLLKFLLV